MRVQGEPKRFYSDEDIQRIGEELWQFEHGWLEGLAWEYLRRKSEAYKPTRTRKDLERLAGAVGGLVDTFSGLSRETEYVLSDLEVPESTELERFRLTLEKLASWCEPHPSISARLYFVSALAMQWALAGMGRPTRRVDYQSGQEYGPFRDLVCACLEPIDPEALKGIDDVIRKATKGWPRMDYSHFPMGKTTPA